MKAFYTTFAIVVYGLCAGSALARESAEKKFERTKPVSENGSGSSKRDSVKENTRASMDKLRNDVKKNKK